MTAGVIGGRGRLPQNGEAIGRSTPYPARRLAENALVYLKSGRRSAGQLPQIEEAASPESGRSSVRDDGGSVEPYRGSTGDPPACKADA